MTLTFYQIQCLLEACQYQQRQIKAGKLNGYSVSYLAEHTKQLAECETILQAEVDRQRQLVIERAGEKK